MIKLFHTAITLGAIVFSMMSAGAHERGALSAEGSALSAREKPMVRIAQSQHPDNILVKKAAARKKKDRKLSHRVSRLAKSAVRRDKSRRANVVPRKRADPDKIDGATDIATVTFGKQKGHLSWPVESRKINMRFGLQEYMVNVHINNLGISIAADKDAVVKSVFDGVVDDIMDIGDGMAVIVRHGKYFSIYSDMGETEVTKGQEIKTGDVLGRMGDGGELEFRLYNEHNVWMDPEKWLAH